MYILISPLGYAPVPTKYNREILRVIHALQQRSWCAQGICSIHNNFIHDLVLYSTIYHDSREPNHSITFPHSINTKFYAPIKEIALVKTTHNYPDVIFDNTGARGFRYLFMKLLDLTPSFNIVQYAVFHTHPISISRLSLRSSF